MRYYIPAIITASVALLAAVGAQILSHYFTIRRERKKEAKKTYQEFIYPFMNDVLFFIDSETEYRNGYDMKTGISGEKIVENIEKQISYGNTHLLSTMISYQYVLMVSKGTEKYKNLSILNIFFWFLDYSYKVIKDIGEPDNGILLHIKKIQKLYGIWFILTKVFDYDTSITILQSKWMLFEDFLDDISIEELVNLRDQSNNSYATKSFIQSIKHQYLKYVDQGDISYVLEIFDEFLKE